MKLDIECVYGDFKTTADWPELWPGHLNHGVLSLKNSGDEGLKRICSYHAATRPEIAKIRGLAVGHGSFRYRESGKSDAEWHNDIQVSGDVAFLE